ncbi:hypothetical protein Fuma_02601 [Fuerstiella marisgermanici]|uniref:Uncharacterized protein n=1 Tax=Fuerstiella marisgermanici TaxID=1891926 RepID=A0A1P8WFZ5_9PLAN|nr:hypothetical protein Fuma_02601 [Fuerstiella marisgermanici]
MKLHVRLSLTLLIASLMTTSAHAEIMTTNRTGFGNFSIPAHNILEGIAGNCTDVQRRIFIWG